MPPGMQIQGGRSSSAADPGTEDLTGPATTEDLTQDESDHDEVAVYQPEGRAATVAETNPEAYRETGNPHIKGRKRGAPSAEPSAAVAPAPKRAGGQGGFSLTSRMKSTENTRNRRPTPRAEAVGVRPPFRLLCPPTSLPPQHTHTHTR